MTKTEYEQEYLKGHSTISETPYQNLFTKEELRVLFPEKTNTTPAMRIIDKVGLTNTLFNMQAGNKIQLCLWESEEDFTGDYINYYVKPQLKINDVLTVNTVDVFRNILEYSGQFDFYYPTKNAKEYKYALTKEEAYSKFKTFYENKIKEIEQKEEV